MRRSVSDSGASLEIAVSAAMNTFAGRLDAHGVDNRTLSTHPTGATNLITPTPAPD